MGNKKVDNVLLLVSFIPLVAMIISMFILPNQVTNYFWGNGTLGKMESKYLNLIGGVVITAIGLSLYMFILKYKKEDHNRMGCYMIGVMLMFIIYIIALLYNQYAVTHQMNFIVNSAKLFMVEISIFMLVTGIFIRKSSKNSIIGIRTIWSMDNDEAWRQTQEIGGAIYVVTAMILIILTFTLKSNYYIAALLISVLVSSIICIFSSYKIYKNKTL